MPKVEVTDTHIVVCSPAVTKTYYPTGPEGVLAPDDHIEQIVNAGNGRRLSERGDTTKEQPAQRPAAPVEAAKPTGA